MTPHTTLICHTTNLVCAASLLLLAAACGGLEEEELSGDTRESTAAVTSASGAAATVTLTADLTYLAADGETSVTLENVTVTHTKGVTVLDGKGSVTRAATTAFVARKLTWLKGDSLPSSGTLTLTQGSLTAVITFLPTTPATGVVLVQIGSLPASEMTLFHVALT